MNFVSKFSLRFGDHSISNFLHQYEAGRNVAHLSNTESSSHRAGKVFGVLVTRQ